MNETGNAGGEPQAPESGKIAVLISENKRLHTEIEDLKAGMEQMEKTNKDLKDIMAYYANPNTPPSAASLE